MIYFENIKNSFLSIFDRILVAKNSMEDIAHPVYFVFIRELIIVYKKCFYDPWL